MLNISLFYAFIGFDLASYFHMCRKKVTWETWESYHELTDKFIKVGDLPSKESVDLTCLIIERSTACMCKRTMNAITIDEVRRETFVKDGWDLETTLQFLRHS